MNPDKITLETMQKSFYYETQSRLMNNLTREEAILTAKCFLKLYLKQQETLKNLHFQTDLTNFDNCDTI
jgi:hypothetical protein